MDAVLDLVERSNQRGGRMLSVVDLLAAGTFDTPLLCRLLDRILDGRSWFVGARPGGAGKTTIMSALLAMIPPPPAIHLAEPGTGWETAAPGACVVAYEISPGAYEGYIWGEDLRRFAARGAAGCRVVSNLHADTLAEARAQVVQDNRVPEEQFRTFGLFLPIRLSPAGHARKREVTSILEATDGGWADLSGNAPPTARIGTIRAVLEDCLTRKIVTVPAVRAAWLRAVS